MTSRLNVRRTMTAVLVAGLLLGACSSEPEPEPDVGFEDLPEEAASPTAEPSPSASAEVVTTEIDVTTTPDEITPEWVTAVVNTLLAEYGEMTAEILAMPVQDDPTLPDGFEERLDALFEGQYREFAASELAALLVDSEGRRGALRPAGNFESLRFETILIQEEREACIVAVGYLDRSLTRRDGMAGTGLSAVGLGSAPEEALPWRIRDFLPNNDSQGDPNPDETMLEASLEDYGSALDHGCEGGR